MKKAIIFDMGGVLLDLDVEACKCAFKKDLGTLIYGVIEECKGEKSC